MTPINVAKKNLPGLKRDTSQAVVETMQTQSDKFSMPSQARMSENTGLGILVHCTSRGRRGTLEPVMRYFVAGAGLGRFRSLIPCACHATDSQHTVNTTEVGNTIRVGSKTAVKCATTAVVPDIMHVIVDQKLCAEVEQHKLDGINNFDSGHRLVNSLYIRHNTAC